MKLLFCPECEDIRKLQRDKTSCRCGKSWGKYLEDGWHAEVNSQAVLLGIDNNSLVRALFEYQAQAGETGPRVDAFIMPRSNPRVRVIRESTSAKIAKRI